MMYENKQSTNQKYKIFLSCSVIILFFFVVDAMELNEEPILHDHVYLTDVLLLVTSIGLVIITAIGVIFYKNSERNLPWILFLMVAIFWAIGEIVWSQDFQYEAGDPLSYLSEIFWLSAYIFLIGFEITYLKPFKKLITKKILTISVILSIAPTIYVIMMLINADSVNFEESLMMLYCVLDTVVLIPAIIGVILFFRGQVSGIWSLMIIGIIIDSIANIWYGFDISENLYSIGDYVDALYVCSYVIFTFGVWNNIKLFHKSRMSAST